MEIAIIAHDLKKELITQYAYDKALEAILNNTEWPNIFEMQDNS